MLRRPPELAFNILSLAKRTHIVAATIPDVGPFRAIKRTTIVVDEFRFDHSLLQGQRISSALLTRAEMEAAFWLPDFVCSNLPVDLQLPVESLANYKSASQRARVGTESWGAINLFCPSCSSARLNPTPKNHAAIDYYCNSCRSPFQLKSRSKAFGTKIVDAAYSEMRRAILEDRTPNLLSFTTMLNSGLFAMSF